MVKPHAVLKKAGGSLQVGPSSRGRIRAVASCVPPSAPGRKAMTGLHGQATGGRRDAARNEIQVVNHHEAKHGFGALAAALGGGRTFAWPARFRRRARNYEWLATTLSSQALLQSVFVISA